MGKLVFKWRFKNRDWIEYSFCDDEKEFYSTIKKRYGIDKENIVVISIELDNDEYK